MYQGRVAELQGCGAARQQGCRTVGQQNCRAAGLQGSMVAGDQGLGIQVVMVGHQSVKSPTHAFS